MTDILFHGEKGIRKLIYIVLIMFMGILCLNHFNHIFSLLCMTMKITVQAVHTGADLESAVSNCMGYKSEVLSSTR